MEKINVAELLKDCPKGMELNCTIWDNVTFIGIEDIGYINILIKTPCGQIKLSKEGCFTHNCNGAKCVIFPKEKTTWEGFVPPCKFKDGDVIFTHANCLSVGLWNTWISIYKENRNGGVATYIDYAEDGSGCYSDLDGDKALLCMERDILRQRIATEEEKQKLFQAIKDNGYKWNPETKTLEKLVEPKFKVGDKIKHKIENFRDERTIISYGKSGYWTSINDWIKYENQDDWELVPNKFDINTLVPFESRVLTRDDGYSIWQPNVWGLYDKEHRFPYVTTGNRYRYCIPYEGNEHLFNTTNDCDDFYKTWE